MAIIPSGTKFMGVNPNLNTSEKRSTLSNSYQEFYTIDDILSSGLNTLGSYQELYDLVVNEQLTPGSWYKFPYKSVNFLNGWDNANANTPGIFPSYNAREIYEGEEEMLLVQAISSYEIANDAYSENYPGDVIQFAPYTNKIGVNVNIYNGQTLPDSSTVSGFDLQWDGTNAYFNMPAGYPALFGHYFYLYCEFLDYSVLDGVIVSSGVSTNDGITYTVTGTSITGNGSGATFEIKNDATYSINAITTGGLGYQIGDQILILGSQLGGVDGVNDLILEADKIGGYYYYQEGACEPLTPNVSVCQYLYVPSMSRLKVVDGGTKVILLDLTQNDVANYVADSLNINTVYAIGDAYGWITRRNDTLRNINVPFDFRGRKYRRYEVEAFGLIEIFGSFSSGATASDGIYTYVSGATTGSGQGASFEIVVVGGIPTEIRLLNPGRFYGQGDIITINGAAIGGTPVADDVTISITSVESSIGYYSIGTNFQNAINVPADVYKDFSVFSNFENFPNDTFNVQWDGIGGPNLYWYAGYSDNNVFLGTCYENFIGNGFFNNTSGNFYYNKVGIICINNVLTYEIFNNNFGSNFAFNTIRDFDENSIKDTFGYNIIFSCSRSTFGIYTWSNVINGNFFDNTIGSDFYNNYIQRNFANNSIGSVFNNNNIGSDFQHNIVENAFYQNRIWNYFSYNKIGEYFFSNVIRDGFGFGYNTSQGNTIGNYFYANTIGEYFYNNIIADGFYGNTIVDYFQLNNVKTAVSGTDFSTATYVYGNYNCDIFKRYDGLLRLSYIDDLDDLKIDDINV